MRFGSTLSPLLLLALLAFSAWTYFSFERDIAASRQRIAGVSRVIETKSGPIEYAEMGQGPVILVVHGAGGGFDQGLDFTGSQTIDGFRIIAVSRFGYLRTPMPADASVIKQADAHADLLDALGIGRAAVIGVSAGGPSALQFAMRHPEKCAALVMMVPLAYKPPDVPASVPKISPLQEKMLMTLVGSDFAYWFALKWAPSLIIKTVGAVPPDIYESSSERERARIDKFMKNILPISNRIAGIMSDSQVGNSLADTTLENVKVPALLLSVRDDLYGTFVPSQYTSTRIPGAKFVGYETGGHMLMGHYAEAFEEISAFLKSDRVRFSENANTQ
jgi:pimeloyl-ACP methyl ester carboxylesterase